MTVFEQRFTSTLSSASDQLSGNQESPRLWSMCCCTATMTQSRKLRLGRDSICDLTLCQEKRREKAAQMALQ